MSDHSHAKHSFTSDDFSIEGILRQLDEDTEDLQSSLDGFLKDRAQILKNQKLALAKYEAELAEIDSQNSAISNFNPKTATVDHNIFKHLSINKEAEGTDHNQFNNDQLPSVSERINRAPIMLMDQNSYIDRNKKFTELEQMPVPSFEQKKKLREDMFFYLEDSTIEETRLELEIERAKEAGNAQLVDELSDALFVLQRMNCERLNNLITEYQPHPISRTWGSDPEYTKLSRQLVQLADSYAIYDSGEGQKRR